MRRFDDTPLATLVAAAPEAATRIARQVLGRVLELRREEQDVLLETVEVWLATGGSATATAERLFVHPNTVRHRLRRVAEYTGRHLDRPTALAELSTALHALRLLPGGAEPARRTRCTGTDWGLSRSVAPGEGHRVGRSR